jgi:hypothetical protein
MFPWVLEVESIRRMAFNANKIPSKKLQFFDEKSSQELKHEVIIPNSEPALP